MAKERRARIGLALGAGGVLGGAWLAGALAAVVRSTGWAPSRSDYVVGTSAGSVFAALTAAGVAPSELLPATAEALEDMAVESGEWILSELALEAAYRVPRRLPSVLPGSLGLLRNGLRKGGALQAIGGLAPLGSVSTQPIADTIRRAVPHGWVSHPHCWIVACDYETGDRVVFGTDKAPKGDLADCVAASCAIPGFFRPVEVAGRLFADGGLHSMSNVDVLSGRGLDLVIVLSPQSSRHSLGGWHPMSHLAAAVRRLATHQLDLEVEKLLTEGTDVIVIEPTVGDLAAMGHNVMDASRARRVAAVALRTASAQLEQPEVRDLLKRLPAGGSPRRSRFAALLQRVGHSAAASI